ncbi:hypothetical protein KAR91_16035 [Candidatus Pacearchaeota archaeon]|nr:hypothetical protein [Candidatus Pacearchaeota archaeon]
MFGKLFDTVIEVADVVTTKTCEKVVDVIDDPIGTVVDHVTQPIRDVVEIVGGLTEGELRVFAAVRLGTDVVAGMGTSELIKWYEALD